MGREKLWGKNEKLEKIFSPLYLIQKKKRWEELWVKEKGKLKGKSNSKKMSNIVEGWNIMKKKRKEIHNGNKDKVIQVEIKWGYE